MTPSHHPQPETLMAYAAGTLPSATACIVACHLSMCPECARQMRWMDMLGGVLLRQMEPEPISAERVLSDAILAHWSAERRGQAQDGGRKPKIYEPMLPAPLARYLRMNAADITWKPIGSGMHERSIELPKHSGSVKLLRLSAGQHLPEDSISLATEVALVLQGACRDSSGLYGRGDIIEWAEDRPHRPMAAGRPCVCLVADQARL